MNTIKGVRLPSLFGDRFIFQIAAHNKGDNHQDHHTKNEQ
jgi:hypothetical protein